MTVPTGSVHQLLSAALQGLSTSNLQVEVASTALQALWASMRSSILNDLEEEPLYWFLHPDAFQHKYLVSKKLVPDGGSEAHDNIKKYISQMETRHADGDWEQAVVSQLCQIYADNQYLQIRLRLRLDKLEIVLDTDKAWAQQDLSYIINTCLLWLRRLRRRLIILGLSRKNPTAVGNIVKGKPVQGTRAKHEV